MKIKILPKFEDYSGCVIGLTPSTFSRIRNGCSYSVAINQLIKENNLDRSILLPNLSKAAHLGKIIHKLFEERIKGEIPDEEEYEQRWEKYVEQEENEVRNNYPSLRGISFSDYDKLYESCESTMKVEPLIIRVDGKSAKDHVRTIEASVSYPGYIYGIVDRIIIHSDGIEIVDYKSGTIIDDDGKIKESILYQLFMYGICCEYQYGKKVKKLTVIKTSDLSAINIPFQREKFDTLLAEIKSLLENINYAIASKRLEDLQIPTEKSCGLCNCKHICKKYLNSNLRQESIVDGIVIDCFNRNFLKLVDNQGKTFIVNKMDELNIENWDDLLDKHLIFINVSNRIEDVYKRTNRTIIFQMS